jgi:hypothetical protein
MLKNVLIVLVLILLALTVLGFVASNTIRVERGINIQAEPAVVHAQLVDLKTWPEWSAWTQERDPSATWEFTGADSGVGAVWSWNGTKDGLGVGRLEITRSDPQTGIAYDLVFDGDGMQAPGEINLAGANGQTHVTWVYQGELGPKPMGGLLKLFMGGMIGDMIGGDFMTGLEGLKQRVEGTPSEPAVPEAVTPEEG